VAWSAAPGVKGSAWHLRLGGGVHRCRWVVRSRTEAGTRPFKLRCSKHWRRVDECSRPAGWRRGMYLTKSTSPTYTAPVCCAHHIHAHFTFFLFRGVVGECAARDFPRTSQVDCFGAWLSAPLLARPTARTARARCRCCGGALWRLTTCASRRPCSQKKKWLEVLQLCCFVVA
jgi:hypothetical protein